jgi:ketosteroid isomerase-like protein
MPLICGSAAPSCVRSAAGPLPSRFKPEKSRMGEKQSGSESDAIRNVIESWAAAVRRKDFVGILRNHSSDIVMFDVPPPFQSMGIEAYRKSWDLFFSWSKDPIPFDITEMTITAGKDVAFVFAFMRCAGPGPNGEHEALDFRLTVGLRKIDGQWTITHEHHSVPALN